MVQIDLQIQGTLVMKQKGNKKTLIGVVVSDKMDKTVVIIVERKVLEKTFKKYITRRDRYQAHDEHKTCRMGDRVMIEETRPLSRHKRWRVRQIIETAPQQ